MGDKLLTVRETAERLGMTEAGLRWQMHTGNAPKSAVIGGRMRRFRESDVQGYIDAAFEAAG